MSAFYYIMKKNILEIIDNEADAYHFFFLQEETERKNDGPPLFQCTTNVCKKNYFVATNPPSSFPITMEVRSEDVSHTSDTKKCGDVQCNFTKIRENLHEVMIHPSDDTDMDMYMFYQQILLAIERIYRSYCVCQMAHSHYDYFVYVYCNMFHQLYKEKHLEFFRRTKQIYRGFTLLARVYKYRKAHIHNTCDLITNAFPASSLAFPARWNLSNVKTWSVWQHGSLYFFSQRDIIQLWSCALGNAPHFFAEPLPCKNPYNNVEFTKADLYNMYFFIRAGSMRIPGLIQAHYTCDFCLVKMVANYENDIREYAMKKYAMYGTGVGMYHNILNMLDEFAPSICIHPEFPQERLVTVMRPYVYMYLCSKFSIYHSKKYARLLRKKLLDFRKFNLLFGRKVVTNPHTMFGKVLEGAPAVVKFMQDAAPFTFRDI